MITHIYTIQCGRSVLKHLWGVVIISYSIPALFCWVSTAWLQKWRINFQFLGFFWGPNQQIQGRLGMVSHQSVKITHVTLRQDLDECSHVKRDMLGMQIGAYIAYIYPYIYIYPHLKPYIYPIELQYVCYPYSHPDRWQAQSYGGVWSPDWWCLVRFRWMEYRL